MKKQGKKRVRLVVVAAAAAETFLAETENREVLRCCTCARQGFRCTRHVTPPGGARPRAPRRASRRRAPRGASPQVGKVAGLRHRSGSWKRSGQQ